jgi:hypothetical protein
MEVVGDVMNLIVKKAQKVKQINVLHMEVEGGVMNRTVIQAHTVKLINV